VYPVVTTNGTGIVSHVGTVLLAEVADRFGLTDALSEVSGTRRRSGGHDPGRVLVDLAVAIADGAETITDLRVLADQELLHGSVASTATAWRVLASVDAARLAALRTARACPTRPAGPGAPPTLA
jgi:Transposase DDE domain group 1